MVKELYDLKDKEAEDFLAEYYNLVSEKYNDNTNLHVLDYLNGHIRGSNPFAAVLANQILKDKNIEVAGPLDLESLVNSDVLRGTYQYADLALVLRGAFDEEFNFEDVSRNYADITKSYKEVSPEWESVCLSNKEGYVHRCHEELKAKNELARDMYEQVEARGVIPSKDNPVVIPLTELELVNSNNNYGLSFRLKKDAKLYTDFELDENFSRDKGLSKMSLYNKTDLSTCMRRLADSELYGQMVLVKKS